MKLTRSLSTLCALFFLFNPKLGAQKFLSLEIPDSLHRPRFWATAGFGTSAYTAATIGVSKAWYAQYPRSEFHFFNDNDQWMGMDKAGHFFSTYSEARLYGSAARWTGISERGAAWIGAGLGMVIQTTFEILDGQSAEYGFSMGDMAWNLAGGGLFLGQQLAWREQRIGLKMSAFPVKYDETPIFSTDGSQQTSLRERAESLYGTGPINLFLKNYNTLNIWLTVNPRSFLPKNSDSKIPAWLNVAVGHGANNLFVGEPKYEWRDPKKGGALFQIDREKFGRERQLLLSFDVNFKKIKTKRPVLRALFGVLDLFKMPAPALEWNTRRGLIFHPLHF